MFLYHLQKWTKRWFVLSRKDMVSPQYKLYFSPNLISRLCLSLTEHGTYLLYSIVY